MKRTGIALSHDNNILWLRKNAGYQRVFVGLTTRQLGSLRSDSVNLFSRADFLLNSTDSKFLVHLVPNHGQIIEIHKTRDIPVYQKISADGILAWNEHNEPLMAVHCSRITLYENIIEKAISKWLELCEKDLVQSKALIYSGICQKCYGFPASELKSLAIIRFSDCEIKENGYVYFDLALMIKKLLVRQRIPKKNISTVKGFCSCCSTWSRFGMDKFMRSRHIAYSHRRRKEKQRNLLIAKLFNSRMLLGCSTGNCPYVILY